MTEIWTESEDGRMAMVEGRVLQPWYKKINPIWWFMNSEEPYPPDDLYVGRPQWLRVILWYIRNPLQNFGKYVLGVYDRNYTVYGVAPVRLTAWNDISGGRMGFKCSIIWLGRLPLPFASYVGRRVMWYAGWQWWGYFGFKFNILRSDIQIA